MRLNRIILSKFKYFLFASLVVAIFAVSFWPVSDQDYWEIEITGVENNQDYALQIWQDKELRLLLPPPK